MVYGLGYFQSFVPQFLHDKKYSLISKGMILSHLKHWPRRVFFKEAGRSINLAGWATTIISRRNLGSMGFETVDIRMTQKETKEIAARMNVD